VDIESSALVLIRAPAGAGALHGVLPYSSVSADLETRRLAAAPIAGAFIHWHLMVVGARLIPRQTGVLRRFMADAAARWAQAHPALRLVGARKE